GRKANRPPNGYLHVSRTVENAILLFQIKKSVEPHGNHRDIQLFCKKANSRPERSHVPVVGCSAFGKNQNVPATVRQVSGKSKTLAKSRFLRQWENIEEA